MAPAQPEPDSALSLFGLALEVDDHVRDRAREALAGAADDAPFEPVRPAFGMRRDDDLVGAESPERVLDRLQRLPVADLTTRLDARLPQSRQAAVKTLLGSVSRLVVVRDPVPERRVQRRRHDQHLPPSALTVLPNRVAQR